MIREPLWDKILTIKPDFQEEMEYVEQELFKCVPDSTPKTLYDAARHLIMTGGKRIRPALTILAYDAVEKDGNGIGYVTPVANAVELIHTATIIHDDIIDQSFLRRGVESVNAKWGPNTAILAGDMIFSTAYGIIGAHEVREISTICTTACQKLAEGEVLETIHTRNTKMTEEVYLEIIERKTASLFEACTRGGAVMGGGTEDEIERLSRYGFLMGVGFQITDDLLDIVGGEDKFGKPIGIDITTGKATLLILHALKVADPKERDLLERIIYGQTTSKKDIEKATEIIKSTDTIAYASERARDTTQAAKDLLKGLPDTSARKALEMIADFIIQREF